MLERKTPSGRECFLTDEQQELKQTILTSTPADLGWDIASSWNTRTILKHMTYPCLAKVCGSCCIGCICLGLVRHAH
nr:hypothetical protein [Anoxybacillus sp. ST4]